MDLAQTVLIIVVSILTTLLVVLGWHLLQVLTDFRKTLKKVNLVLTDTHEITHALSKPVTGVSNLVTNLQSGAKIVDLVNELAHKVEEVSHKFKKTTPEPPPLTSPTEYTSNGDKKPRFFKN